MTMNDSTVILDFLFNGGPPPGCLAAADADGSTAINQPDSIYILNFLNLAGPPPPAPYPICGVDPTTPLSCLQKQCAFIRGDVDNNGEVNPADATAILNFLNLGIPIPCLDAADSNDDGAINVTDATFLLNSLLIGSVPIPAPGPHVCGFDPTADTLGCAQYTCIPPEDFRRGDCNVDGNIDISDAVFVLGLLFPPAMAAAESAAIKARTAAIAATASESSSSIALRKSPSTRGTTSWPQARWRRATSACTSAALSRARSAR